MPIQNAEIPALLSQEAGLLEIQGANPFRVRAYRRAAQTIDALPRSVASVLAAGEDLTALPGIGQDLASKIAEIVKTALSRCHAKSASGLRLTDFQAAATASRHVVIAAARSTR